MKINVYNPENCLNFQPVTCTRQLSDCHVAGSTIKNLLEKKIITFLKKYPAFNSKEQINIRSDFWPSEEILLEVIKK